MTELAGRALFELVAILSLLALNGLLALSEIAVVSSNRTRLQQMAADNPRALDVLALIDDPTAFLSTVQVGITLVGILAGALSGATLSVELALLMAKVAWLAPYAELLSFSLIVVLVTFMSLLIGELIPKSIALSNPERFAIAVVPLMRWLAHAAAPVVTLLSAVTETVLRLLRIAPNEQPLITEEEIKVLLAEGAEAGIFEPQEQELVTQALELDDITLRPLITHRTRVHWIDQDDSAADILDKISEHHHSAFPLCNGSLDRVVGVLSARDFLLAYILGADHAVDLQAIARPAILTPLSAAPSSIMHLFNDPQTRMVFALDEYGGIEGIVTQADVVAALTAGAATPSSS